MFIIMIDRSVTFFSKMFDQGLKNTEEEVKRGAETIEKALEKDKKR